MSLQQWNEAHAIAVLVIGTFAAVFFAALGTVMWEAGTQKVDWCVHIVALGFLFLGGTFFVFAIGLFLDTFHWLSLAQKKFLDHLFVPASTFSITMVVGGSAIGCFMDSIADRKR